MTIRKTLTSIVLAVALALGVAGCKDNSNQESKTREPIPSHFASVPMRYETGLSMTSGDFDGDGDLDLVIGAYANRTGEARAYLLRNQNGQFSEPSHFASVPMRYETGLSMTSGDFDGDGDLDLVIGAYANRTGEARAYRFNNDGEGNFSQ